MDPGPFVDLTQSVFFLMKGLKKAYKRKGSNYSLHCPNALTPKAFIWIESKQNFDNLMMPKL